MKILRLVPAAFGRFHAGQPLDLDPGLNVIIGGNEAGKSTLQAFILGMLYGFKKEGLSRVRRTGEFERYRPWSGRDYAGVLVYEHSGKIYRIERSFDPDSTVIYDDVTGEDISTSFSQDMRREYDFAQRHLGLSAREFVNTVWIGQLKAKQEEGIAREIQAKILDVSTDDDERTSVAEVLSVLEAERKRVGTPRTTEAALNKVSARIAGLERERESAELREREIKEHLQEASTLLAKKEEKEALAGVLKKKVVQIRYTLLRKRLEHVSKLCEEIASLRTRERELAWSDGADEKALERLAVLGARLAEIQKTRVSLESSLEKLQRERSDLVSRLDSLKSVVDLGVTEAEVASAYSAYAGLKAARLRAERKLAARKQEESRLVYEAGVQGVDTIIHMDSAMAERLEKVQAELESAQERERDAVAELERTRATLMSLNPLAGTLWLYVAAVAAAIAALAGTFLARPWSWGAFVMALVLFVMGIFRHMRTLHRKAAQLALLRERERRVTELEDEVMRSRQTLQALLSSCGVLTTGEFRRRWHTATEYRERIRAAREAVAEALEELESASKALSGTEDRIVKWLQASGCTLVGETVTEAPVTRLCELIREVKSAEQAGLRLDNQISSVLGQIAETDEQISRLTGERASILAAQGVTSEKELEERVRACRALEQARRQIAGCKRNLDLLLAGRAQHDLEQELSLLAAEPEVAGSGKDLEDFTDGDLEDARRELTEVEREIGKINERLGRLEELVRVKSEGRALSEIVEELEELKSRRSTLEEDSQALLVAAEIIERISAEIHREFAPQLSRRAGDLLATITGERYREVKLTPELEMSVVDPETHKAARVVQLSAGAADQAYFALRIALAEVLSGRNDFPMFLDDSFVQYDEHRLRGALLILGSLKDSHQILLFTCHGREQKILDFLGISYRAVDIGQMGW